MWVYNAKRDILVNMKTIKVLRIKANGSKFVLCINDTSYKNLFSQDFDLILQEYQDKKNAEEELANIVLAISNNVIFYTIYNTINN